MMQQRPVISRSELRQQIELILMESVPGTADGPNLSMLRKANTTADRIMRLIDSYHVSK